MSGSGGSWEGGKGDVCGWVGGGRGGVMQTALFLVFPRGSDSLAEKYPSSQNLCGAVLA